jgi:hypothetical protein
VALAVLLLAPVTGPGFVLVRDMVFVPRLPLSTALLGVDGVPRAVPSDLVVALLSRVVTGGWLQDVVLLAVVVGGAWGAARLVPSERTGPAVVAATVYGWSAYLHERLLLGQWALLIGWAVLPWAARAALNWRRGGTASPVVVCLAVAAIGGASAELLVALVVVVCGRPLRALAASAVFALPWAVPGLIAPHGLAGGDPRGVAAFASRSDSWLGVLGSLLTGGGVWAPAAVPPGRSAGLAAAVLVLLLAAAGLHRLTTALGPRLWVAALAGLVLSLLGRLPSAAAALRWAVVHVPASGLLRDGQKWIAPVVLLVAVAAACGLEAVRAKVAGPRVRQLATVLAAVAPLAALPGAAWGEGGRLQTSHYPPAWQQVADVAGDRTVVVLPWSLYRAFPWTGNRTVLDPAPRWLRGRVVVNDDLPLSTGVVRGEDPVARALDPALRGTGPVLTALRQEGIELVLVERTTRGATAAAVEARLAGLQPLVRTQELSLWEVPGTPQRRPPRAPLWPVLLGDGAAVLLAAGASWWLLADVVHRRDVGGLRRRRSGSGRTAALGDDDARRRGAGEDETRDDRGDGSHGGSLS